MPVVIFDSGLKGGEIVSFVATDNDKGGELAGEHLGKALGGKGKVILMRYAEGHDSTRRREEGFLRGLARACRASRSSAATSTSAPTSKAPTSAPRRCSRRYKAADGTLGVDGMFAPNESSAFAVMRVLQDNGWAGKVKFIGFDASDGLLAGLRGGAIEALVVQDPVRMGYLSVVTHGEAPARRESRDAASTPASTSSRATSSIARHQAARPSPDLSQMKLTQLASLRRASRCAASRSGSMPPSRWRRRRSRGGAGRGVRPGRRERRRQEHADGDPRPARSQPDAGDDGARRRSPMRRAIRWPRAAPAWR